MNRQRVVIYRERREVLEGADLHEQISRMVDEVVADYAKAATSDGYPEEWDLDKLWRAFRQLYPVSVSIDEVVEEAGGDRAGLSGDFITEVMREDAQKAYERREEEFGSEVMRELERRVVLSVLDRKWREHLYEMDYLREGIGLRGYGQRDPLVEYQREGYDMFTAMMDGIKEESVGSLFNLQVQVQENPIVEETAIGDGLSISLEDPEAASPAAPAQGTTGLTPGGPAPGGSAPGGPAPARFCGRQCASRACGRWCSRPRQRCRARHPRPRQRQVGDAAVGRAPPARKPAAGQPVGSSGPAGRPACRARATPAPAAELLGAVRRRQRARRDQPGSSRRRQVRPRGPQRPVPVRLWPEVQALPRRPGAALRLLAPRATTMIWPEGPPWPTAMIMNTTRHVARGPVSNPWVWRRIGSSPYGATPMDCAQPPVGPMWMVRSEGAGPVGPAEGGPQRLARFEFGAQPAGRAGRPPRRGVPRGHVFQAHGQGT